MSSFWSRLGELLVADLLVTIGVVLVVAAHVILLIDTCLRLAAPSQTEFYPALSGDTPETVSWTRPTKIFYFADAFTGAKKSTDAVRSTWSDYGDVLCFGYGYKRFVARQKVSRIVSTIQYVLSKSATTRIVLIASGMGAMVAVDVWRQLRRDLMTRDNWSCQVELIVVGGVCGIDNMKQVDPKFVKALRWLPVGPIAERLLGQNVQRRLPQPSIKDVQKNLDAHSVSVMVVAGSAQYPLSMWRDLLVHAYRHVPIEPAAFMGLSQVTYVWSNSGVGSITQPDELELWRRSVVWRPSPDWGPAFEWCRYFPAPEIRFVEIEVPVLDNETLKSLLESPGFSKS